MKIISSAAVLLFLIGCSPTIKIATPASVIIDNCLTLNQAEALTLAELQCNYHDKNAVFIPDNQKDGLCYYECK